MKTGKFRNSSEETYKMLLYELAAPVAIGFIALFGLIAVFYLTRSTIQLSKDAKESNQNMKALLKAKLKKNEESNRLIQFSQSPTNKPTTPAVAIPTAGQFSGFGSGDLEEIKFQDSEAVETDIQF